MSEAQSNRNIGGTPTAAPLADIGVEFVDHQGLTRMFAIRRSHAYVLATRGCIKSVCIRKPGSIKGRRLFHVQSVREFLNSHLEASVAE